MLFSACCCCQSSDDNPSRIGSRRKIDIGTGAPSGQMAALAYIEGTATLKPVTGAGGHGMGGGFKYSSDFAWFQFPDTDLSTAGAKTVALSSCPPSVVASEKFYYVFSEKVTPIVPSVPGTIVDRLQ